MKSKNNPDIIHISPIKIMCKVLKLNRSTAYKVMHHRMSDYEVDRVDLESRLMIYLMNMKVYMVHLNLNESYLNKDIMLLLSE